MARTNISRLERRELYKPEDKLICIKPHGSFKRFRIYTVLAVNTVHDCIRLIGTDDPGGTFLGIRKVQENFVRYYKRN